LEIDPQESPVAESKELPSDDRQIQLKDPFVAGVLAWLVPGAGHFYQGRYAKAALYFICILGTFVYGLYIGGSNKVGWGRAVYFSFRPNDLRLPWLCQIGVGLPTVPMTLVQWKLQDKPLFDGFMAPPALRLPETTDSTGAPADPPPPSQMSLAWINRLLPHYFEMGTVYTMIAGLLNILAIYDACCGPVPAEVGKKEEESAKRKSDTDSGEEKS
jgi:hypothetical protein